MRGFYHGFGMTILRDVPFAALQFALYEHLKRRVALYTDQPTSKPWQAAVCASIAGATAGALTTPLDVLKTRVMTTHNLAHNISLTQHLKSIHQQHGLKGLLSGIIPRTLWISFGGFVFLGVYEHTLSLL
jgi:solute carrier family 25 S-adenosylmethionine transporter 26